MSFLKCGRELNLTPSRPSRAAARNVRTCTWSSWARTGSGTRSCGDRLAFRVRAWWTIASGVGRRPASQVRNVSRATPRAVAHSVWDKPSRARISLSGDAEPVTAHDDAIGPQSTESEWTAMRIRRSQRLGNAPKTAESISDGRFRPVAASGEMSPDSEVQIHAFAKSGQEWRARLVSNQRPPA